MGGGLAGLIPKGARECGAHQWYRADVGTWRCYHCRPALATSSPWTQEQHLERTLGGIDATLRGLALRGEPRDQRELGELQRLAEEALAALPEEEWRLERLVGARAAELPGLAQALRSG
jgi:hypothetical protein